MKTSMCFCTFFFTIATLFPVTVSAQNHRLMVVSPRVGVVIDSLEATTYKLFKYVKYFESASFYQASDSTFGVAVKLKSVDGILRDTSYAINFGLVRNYAERIDHWEAIQQGSYTIGTSKDNILYEDGTPVSPMKDFAYLHRLTTDFLPLATNTSGLWRPIFETISFDISFGLILSDLSELEQLTGSATNISLPLSFYIQIPITDDPLITFIGGWGFAFGGNITSFSSILMYRPNDFFSHNLIIGLGGGMTRYNYTSGALIIRASDSYPMLLFGWNIAPNTLDIILTYSLSKDLNTTFESKSYTIKPAGFGLFLLLNL